MENRLIIIFLVGFLLVIPTGFAFFQRLMIPNYCQSYFDSMLSSTMQLLACNNFAFIGSLLVFMIGVAFLTVGLYLLARIMH